ncbi:hypothetical protein FB566_2140 [Stackebrandtia endophytica]|uniref:Uncharacterized protein n=1 Tax=Stackebrandtia endophytica TaxID=1496996 RepID=A0A543AVK7_9ACTN|nr:hypothetical protein [Stackebrandtia endophytica]TQL76607.1 hypothetical protein FB566_2140 [Stackebrandtia endophytica]
MGWNTTAVFVENTDPTAALAGVGLTDLRVTEENVPFDTATSKMEAGFVFTAQSGAWTEIWDPELRAVGRLIGAEPTIETTHRVLAVVFSSVASTYGFAWFEAGQLVRRVVYADGEVVDQAGDPLPMEATMEFPSWGPDEDFVFEVVKTLTDCDVDYSTTYRRHELPER